MSEILFLYLLLSFAFSKYTSSSSVLRMGSDELVEIPPVEWIELRELFSHNWPENHVAWQTINNFVNWFRTDPDIKHLKILSLNGTWRSDGTYIVIVSCFSNTTNSKR